MIWCKAESIGLPNLVFMKDGLGNTAFHMAVECVVRVRLSVVCSSYHTTVPDRVLTASLRKLFNFDIVFVVICEDTTKPASST